MNNPLPNAAPRPSPEILERLDIPTLVHRAQVYMDSGHPNEAMPFIRTAVRRAPLRRDLRRLLVMAVEAGADPGETELIGSVPLGASAGPAASAGDARPELRHTFMRPRAHPASSKPVFFTIAIVTAGVGALILAWTLLRGAGPGLPGADPSDFADASASSEAVASEDPNQWILLELQEYEGAGKIEQALERAADITDSSLRGTTLARLYTRQARAFEKAGRLQSARTAYENAIAYDAENVELLRSLGSVLYELGRHRQPTRRDEALEYFDLAGEWLGRARLVSPGDTGTLLLLARLEIARDDDAAAADHLRRIVGLDPESSDADRAREILAQRNLRL